MGDQLKKVQLKKRVAEEPELSTMSEGDKDSMAGAIRRAMELRRQGIEEEDDDEDEDEDGWD